jgi:hypothetical protein
MLLNTMAGTISQVLFDGFVDLYFLDAVPSRQNN